MKKFIYSVIIENRKGFFSEILKFVLWLLSCLYGLGVQIRTFLYKTKILRSHHFNQPVISVGNLTAGGTGKTPLIIMIAQWLRERQKKVVILTRGYMDGNLAQESDEAAMLQSRLPSIPVLVGPNRIRNAQEFLKNNSADLFLLDDGFQHLQVSRDLNILTIDSINPWGYGYLLPRGLLREPLSALKRADVFVLTKTNSPQAKTEELRQFLQSLKPTSLIVETVHDPVALVNVQSETVSDLLTIRNKSVCAFCSIGDPLYFEWTLRNLGARVVKTFSFIDHHVYSQKDIEEIIKFCDTQGIKMLVTTHKDAVKLKPFLNLFQEKCPVFYLEVQLKVIQGQELLLDRIHRLLQH